MVEAGSNSTAKSSVLRISCGPPNVIEGTGMRRLFVAVFFFIFIAALGFAQSNYQVIAVKDGATIAGTVKWSGPMPRALDFPITKDQQICDPASRKTADLERLIVGRPEKIDPRYSTTIALNRPGISRTPIGPSECDVVWAASRHTRRC